MFEYGAVFGNELGDIWNSQLLPLFDAICSSPYFWPAVAGLALTFLLFVRQFTK